MLPDFEPRLRAFAEVIGRVGLNLQPGQRLLIAEPYELQGVARSAEVIVEAVRNASGHEVEVLWGDGARLREFAEQKDWRGFARLVATNAKVMERGVRNGEALLFLQGSQPALLDGIASESVAELRRIGWEHFGPVAQQLVRGETNWTVAPAPSPGWAKAAYGDLPSAQRLAALWDDVFQACRVPRWSATSGRAEGNPPGGRVPPQDAPATAWQAHLGSLQKRRDELNQLHLASLRYEGDGTDLTVDLPSEHVWCTAQLTTRSGISFVANLPTEEVFTVPHRDSAEGTVRVSRPVSYGGAVISGIELKFRRGRVVEARARTGEELLKRLLDTDEGAGRLGEVALVGNVGGSLSPDSFSPRHGTAASSGPTWRNSGRLYYHPLLDENASNHIALGEAYGFCLRSPHPTAPNHSLIHVDLSLDAGVALGSGVEPP